MQWYWKYLGLAIVFLWFMGGGVQHFTNVEVFMSIMPPWLGWHLALVYISGVFEILGAIGILIPRLRQLSGNCLIALVICVTPVNVWMWLNPDLFPEISLALLSIRLVVQGLLLACIWWSTRMPQSTQAATTEG
ncbi:MAG: putative membrane protein [Gammaproteobacteria bacterium]|jgi:uncharacterized membrane protein